MTEIAPPDAAVRGEIIEPLTRDEAERLTALAQEQAVALWRTLLRLYEGEAHKALGYSSWGDYFRDKFGKGASHAYRLLRAARVEAQVSVHVDTRGMTEAQARVLVPLTESQRLATVALVVEAGGFAVVSARKLAELRDQVLGRRITSNGHLAWDDRAMRSIAAAVEKLNMLDTAFGTGEDLRAVEPEDAARIRALVAAALSDVGTARRKTERVIEQLEAAAKVLDARPDLPPPSFITDWHEVDSRSHGHQHRQLSLRDLLDLLVEADKAD